MHPDTDYLKTIAEEIAANPTKNTPNSKPNHHLEREAKRVEKSIILNLHAIENFTQRDTFHFNTLSKLVNICDILFDFTNTLNADVQVILDLLSNVKEVLPSEIRPNLKLCKAFIVNQEKVFNEIWLAFKQQLVAQGIDNNLVEIAGIPFKRFTLSRHKLYWSDFVWLKGYISKLEIMDWENADCNSKTEALMSLLIGRDFNDERFYIYCKKYIQARIKTVNGKHNRLLELAGCEKLVLQDTQVGMLSFDLRANSVSARLIKWIKEEIDFVETHEREKPYSKFQFDWTVEVIAFFFKLLHERKVFGKVKLEPFAEQIAANCSSTGREEFQAATIHSRFYFKDIEVIRYIEKLLEEMLETVRLYLK